jgi:chemotaxis protein CheD
LAELKIPIIAQDVGENYGRTVFFYSQDGRVEIKSTVKGIRQL